MTTLLLIMSFVLPVRAAHRGASVHQTKAMGALRRRCDGGSGEACSAYAKMLRLYGTKSEKDLANSYVRKACRMSYQPACGEVAPSHKARTHFR